MAARKTPVLFILDRAPRFRLQLVDALRRDGREAYGVQSLAQALRLLDLFPVRFRVWVDLRTGSPAALQALQWHPGVEEVTVLSTRLHGPRRGRGVSGTLSALAAPPAVPLQAPMAPEP